MQYTTTLTGLEFFAYHGIYPEEQQIGATFLVDIKVTRTTQEHITELNQATDYEIIYNIAKLVMEKRENLIETVAQQILANLKGIYQKAQVEVTIHKPNPAGLFKCGVASVTFSV